MEDLDQQSVALHARVHGKLEIHSRVPLHDHRDLSLAYTPGVAQVCMEIAKAPARVFDLTIKRNTVAVVSDGSAILGLGNLGASAAIPVMEGKAVLFKAFANVDAFPICLDTQDADEIVSIVRALAPVFGGVNLEDISAPRCFAIESKLQDLGIPVFHDDQHGTAIVVLAAVLNALEVTGKHLADVTVAFSGSGAAAIACARLIGSFGTEAIGDIILCDSKGIVHRNRSDLNPHKRELAERFNRSGRKGTLADALRGADVFIGLSQPDVATADMIRSMNPNPIVFAMANPVPEIMPDVARAAGAVVVGTGRSDFPNQINNVLAFPGIFRGALDAGAIRINAEMKLAAARALASAVVEPSPERVLPDPFDKRVHYRIADAVAAAARHNNVCRAPWAGGSS
jgi:malate dehydrogenase (oxaloacetate-decarboxylating)